LSNLAWEVYFEGVRSNVWIGHFKGVYGLIVYIIGIIG